MWQWTGHALSWARAAHLPVFNAVAWLVSHGGPSAIGTWQGWPHNRLLSGSRRHVAAPDPFLGGKGSPGPRGQSGWTGLWGSSSHVWRRRTPQGGWSGPVEVRPEHHALVGTWRRRTYKSTGRGPENMIPAVRPGPYASSPKGQGRGHG
jgi:hypothetical protein